MYFQEATLFSLYKSNLYKSNHCKTCKYKILHICLIIRKIIIYDYHH